MKETFVPAAEIRRITPGDGAAQLATVMYDRLLEELEDLDRPDWDAATVCAPWTVADIVRHLVGAAKGHASLREQLRQVRHARRHKAEFDGNELDAMNALQVGDHTHLGAAELITSLRAIAPRAVAKRMSRPRLLHPLRVPTSSGGSTAPGTPTDLTLGHLLTVVLTRDVFLHRVDIARATGRELRVDDREGRLVADVVGEWAERHRAPFRLALSGPAGGRYGSGVAGPQLDLDAIELCWVLSGRGPAVHPLLETRVFF